MMNSRTTWEQTAIDLRIKLDITMHERDIARKSLQKANVELDQQEKYAELGQLALTTRASVCGSTDFKKFHNRCEKHCTNYEFCQKRAELLEGGKNGQ